MRKALVILFVVATLGTLAAYFGPGSQQGKEVGESNSTTVTLSSTPAPTASPTTSASSTSVATASPTSTPASSVYKNGTYKGSLQSHHYGEVQVSIDISGGKITNVNFLTMPTEADRSQMISEYAAPQLESQTIKAQSANIDGVSGATLTSMSYIRSLQAALDAAKI